MAFEDRFSPNTATSPNNNNDNVKNYPNSPESSHTSPYTCLTTKQQQQQQKDNFLKITSFALKNCTPSSPSSSSSSSSTSSSRPNTPTNNNNNNEPTIQTLKYSIFNILQPDFGKNAVLKTKSYGKINFKPYEDVEDVIVSSDGRKNDKAPLGSLCQTVSQIGSAVKTKNLIGATKSDDKKDDAGGTTTSLPTVWPAWVYCTRYSDRPSSGPRSRRMKKLTKPTNEEKRPRTAFSSAQLARLKNEFNENRYLNDRRRQQLSAELGLNEAQIKIWFQNKRAKLKKSSNEKNPLALQLMAQGLYNHSTVSCDDDEMNLGC